MKTSSWLSLKLQESEWTAQEWWQGWAGQNTEGTAGKEQSYEWLPTASEWPSSWGNEADQADEGKQTWDWQAEEEWEDDGWLPTAEAGTQKMDGTPEIQEEEQPKKLRGEEVIHHIS